MNTELLLGVQAQLKIVTCFCSVHLALFIVKKTLPRIIFPVYCITMKQDVLTI